jgi:hypothetical protein
VKKVTCRKCGWSIVFPSGPRDIRDIVAQSIAQSLHIAKKHRELLQGMPNPANLSEDETDKLFDAWFTIEELQEV